MDEVIDIIYKKDNALEVARMTKIGTGYDWKRNNVDSRKIIKQLLVIEKFCSRLPREVLTCG